MTVFVKKMDVIKSINEICPINKGSLISINYNTYLMLTPLFKALIVSTNNQGKYNLKVTDNKNGFYFYYEELNLKIKVPLSAVFNTNDKLKGILAIKWSSAILCPSRLRGLCQLPKDSLCYAIKGELQGSKKPHNFLMGMGSYYNSLLSIYYWNLFYNDIDIQKTFKKYCNFYNVDTLRFNLSGDFKNLNDIKNFETLALMGLKLTGYTARDDLRTPIKKVLNNHDNIILNGSNMMYTNRFKATDNIYHYLTSKNRCKGGCLSNGCLNCYKLKNEIITVLIHGSSVGTDLNTPNNRAFISWVFKLNGLNITSKELKGGDIYAKIKKIVNNHNLWDDIPSHLLKVTKDGTLKFKGHNAIINYIEWVIISNGFKVSDYNKGGS